MHLCAPCLYRQPAKPTRQWGIRTRFPGIRSPIVGHERDRTGVCNRNDPAARGLTAPSPSYTFTMARRKTLIVTGPLRDRSHTIRVRLDARTVITLGNIKALDFWKQRYPQAQVIA